MDFNCICWGRGEITCEDAGNNDRLFAWPCPFECKPGGVAFIKFKSKPKKPKKKKK